MKQLAPHTSPLHLRLTPHQASRSDTEKMLWTLRCCIFGDLSEALLWWSNSETLWFSNEARISREFLPQFGKQCAGLNIRVLQQSEVVIRISLLAQHLSWHSHKYPETFLHSQLSGIGEISSSRFNLDFLVECILAWPYLNVPFSD